MCLYVDYKTQYLCLFLYACVHEILAESIFEQKNTSLFCDSLWREISVYMKKAASLPNISLCTY